MLHSVGHVDIQHVDRDTADRRYAQQHRVVPLKMLMPDVATRMIETSYDIQFEVESRKIGSFESVAIAARQRKIVKNSRSMMLDGTNMVNLEWQSI